MTTRDDVQLLSHELEPGIDPNRLLVRLGAAGVHPNDVRIVRPSNAALALKGQVPRSAGRINLQSALVLAGAVLGAGIGVGVLASWVPSIGVLTMLGVVLALMFAAAGAAFGAWVGTSRHERIEDALDDDALGQIKQALMRDHTVLITASTDDNRLAARQVLETGGARRLAA